ncbi:MAG: hypothetical protein AAF333_13275 [Planctomycetota bacterium]
MPLILALSDGWQIAMFTLNMVSTIVLAIVLMWVKNRTSKIDELEAEVKDHANGLINTKFGELDRKVTDILQRLDRGDREFRTQHDRDHALELRFVNAVNELRQDMTQKLACREDLLKLTDRVQRNELAIAQLRQGGDA